MGHQWEQSELKNNLNISRLWLKQIDDQIESEKSKNYVQVGEIYRSQFINILVIPRSA